MKLKRELNLLHVFSIATGVMISAGIFVLPGLAYAKAGPGMIVAYVLAGLLALTGMLSQAELASAMPKSGGTYFYVTRSMGTAVGTVYGLITWFALCLKSAFDLVGIGLITALLTDVPAKVIIVPLCAVFVLINILGIEVAGRIQVVLVMAIMAVLVFFVSRGFPDVNVHHFQPFAPKGLGAIFATAGFVFVCYGGLLKVASVAEEVKDPGRDIPLGMILAMLITATLYAAVTFVTVGVLSGDVLGGGTTGSPSLVPITDAAGAFLGPWGRIVLSITAVLAFLTASNAGIMAASRYPYALAKDNMLPENLGKISNRFKTPHVSVIVTGVFIVLSLFLKLDILIKAASSVLILTYMFTCLAIIILRESRIQNYQPKFRAPLYPWIQFTGIVGFVFLLLEMGTEALVASLVLIASGLFVYWFYGRIRAGREFALLHLIERITAKELTAYSLETELKDIVRERDDIAKDRFDHVIEECHVVDIDRKIGMEAFFKRATDEMADRLEIEPDLLLKAFLDRENESSTVLNPFLAIPHIVIEGEHHVDILLARCREGIAFSETAPHVHTVFCLVGTKDERPFHLRALAAIAAIVQDPDFEKKWMAAKNVQALRDVVLLGKRIRHQPP